MSKRRPREEACYICGHYHDYEGGQACSICGHVMTPHETKQSETVIPTHIIPGFLYLGSYDTASRSELLKAMGITHILNTVPTCQALFKNTFTYHTVSETPPDFKECFEFIDSLTQSPNNKVLVYCMSGTSRSPTVVIGYLMRARGWRLAESYKWVKGKRSGVHINPADAKRLMDLELEIHGSCSVPQGLAALDAACGLLPADVGGGAWAAGGSTSAQDANPPQPAPAATPGSAPVFGGQGQWSLSSGPQHPMLFGQAAGGAQGPSLVFGGGPGGAPVFGASSSHASGGGAAAGGHEAGEMEM